MTKSASRPTIFFRRPSSAARPITAFPPQQINVPPDPADTSPVMADIIDMPSVPVAPSYASILKGAGQIREEASSCDRVGTMLFSVGVVTALGAWAWAIWTLAAWRGGGAADVQPLGVIAVTSLGFGIFLMTWTMCGNFRRRS